MSCSGKRRLRQKEFAAFRTKSTTQVCRPDCWTSQGQKKTLFLVGRFSVNTYIYIILILNPMQGKQNCNQMDNPVPKPKGLKIQAL